MPALKRLQAKEDDEKAIVAAIQAEKDKEALLGSSFDELQTLLKATLFEINKGVLGPLTSGFKEINLQLLLSLILKIYLPVPNSEKGMKLLLKS